MAWSALTCYVYSGIFSLRSESDRPIPPTQVLGFPVKFVESPRVNLKRAILVQYADGVQNLALQLETTVNSAC